MEISNELRMDTILDDEKGVMGHIYLITNRETNKQYVGQTLSHRKNRGKYRPFGYIGRFNDHVSEALCNTKKKQCVYLNNAIRSYGKDAFRVELLHVCERHELDLQESKYIKEYDTLCPNGYNLTIGGKVFKQSGISDEKVENTCTPRKRGGCVSRSEETRAKMTKSLKMLMASEEVRQELMERTQQQHLRNKMALFRGIHVDLSKLDTYIRVRNKKDGTKFIKVVIEGKTTSFVGKYLSIEDLKHQAIQFIYSIQSSATLPNCSGNP